MEKESWKEISNFPGYQISSTGRVKGLRFCRPMKPHACSGYLRIALRKNDKQTWHLIHRLVLEAFVGECPQGFQCAHLNGIRTDNRLENLAWTSPKENYSHRYQHGTDFFGEKNPRAKLTQKQAEEIRSRYRCENRKSNATMLAAEYRVSREAIFQIAFRRNWRDKATT